MSTPVDPEAELLLPIYPDASDREQGRSTLSSGIGDDGRYVVHCALPDDDTPPSQWDAPLEFRGGSGLPWEPW